MPYSLVIEERSCLPYESPYVYGIQKTVLGVAPALSPFLDLKVAL